MTRVAILAGAAILCGGCSTVQSALDPQSAQAAGLHDLIRLFVVVCGVVWLAVMAALGGALLKRRPFPDPAPAERRAAVAVVAAVVATVAIVSGLTIASFLATRSFATSDRDPLVVRLRAYQWWWEVTYPAAGGDLTAANEIHVPVGRPVRIELSSADVVHSFWIPQLGGKQDLVPGRDNAILFTVERPGVYRGQCAEFCGLQHARMGLLVIAEPQGAFDAWVRAQAAPAAQAASGEARAGAEIFQRKACSACHAVRGTPAVAKVGPDLTHLASRRTIAAGALETTRGALAAWIADPQTIKPGANMPAVTLSAEELRAVSAYMASLE